MKIGVVRPVCGLFWFVVWWVLCIVLFLERREDGLMVKWLGLGGVFVFVLILVVAGKWFKTVYFTLF